jgi:hypothetical protein
MGNKLFAALVVAPFLALAPIALASTTWYVNGVRGSDSNNCKSPTTACKTIKRTISLASSGDAIMVAAATYKENLTIGKSLNVIGSGAATTIIDGGGINTVVTVSNTNAHVGLAGLTIQNGSAPYTQCGGGIYNTGAVSISNSTVSGNHNGFPLNVGGICNVGTLAISNSTVSRNRANRGGGIINVGKLTISTSTISGNQGFSSIELLGQGAGISNFGQLTINTSTISGNSLIDGFGAGIYSEGTATIDNSTVSANSALGPFARGGGIYSAATATIDNSTVSANSASRGGGIEYGGGNLLINGSTISGNSAPPGHGGDIDNFFGTGAALTLRNTIVANSPSGGNCSGGNITSKGYNLSSDDSCDFDGRSDMNNTNPMLGPLQYNGGPTKTQALLAGSPAIDSGNPSGCTDGQGHLLKTDQRGMPRPDREDAGGCDIGAYERQSD